MLLLTGGLLARSYGLLTSKDSGLDENVVAVSLRLTSRYADFDEQVALFTEISQGLRGLPEVAGAAFVDAAPLGGHSKVPIEIEGEPSAEPSSESDRVMVGPGYFEAIGARMLQGRSITQADRAGAVSVVVVNETFVRTFLPQGALGGRVRQGPDDPNWHTVVGVVSDIRQQGPFPTVVPHIYLPWAQNPEPGPMALIIRPMPGAAPLDRIVREAVRSADPAIAVSSLETVAGRFYSELAGPRIQLALIALFAGTSLGLALIGVFGVVSHGVRRRRRELAIRVTLGADADGLVNRIVIEGVLLGAVGLLIGFIAAAGAGGTVSRFLYGVSPRDPATWLGTALLLLLATATASWFPARQASRLDPSVTLRQE